VATTLFYQLGAGGPTYLISDISRMRHTDEIPVVLPICERYGSRTTAPKVTIILLDWSCRESFHSLDYLGDQTVARDEYEIVWIEYYSRKASEIEGKLNECKRLGMPPVVDKWIIMGMPEDVYYHKHLMYNIGMLASEGEIVVFCDSDAIFSPTFVESIERAFEEDRNIVLHVDEVRNTDRRYYPFNYPSIEQLMEKGCINWRSGKTTGLLDKEDPLHTLNYGACMCALREDLIAIGGADEHIDYLGHICGPYELTFRLVNAGKREVWHQEEFLYHAWHPGTDGKNNYCGPHDGFNMSTTALDARRTGRVLPLVENPAVALSRMKNGVISFEQILVQAIPERDLKVWTRNELKNNRTSVWVRGSFFGDLPANIQVAVSFIKMLVRQFHGEINKVLRQPKSLLELPGKVFKIYDFLKDMADRDVLIIKKCTQCMKKLDDEGVKEIGVYGTGDIAEILYKMTSGSSITINAVFDDDSVERSFFGMQVKPVEAAQGYAGIIVIAAAKGSEHRAELLKRLLIAQKQIFIL
jgi:hypothetical protein